MGLWISTGLSVRKLFETLSDLSIILKFVLDKGGIFISVKSLLDKFFYGRLGEGRSDVQKALGALTLDFLRTIY